MSDNKKYYYLKLKDSFYNTDEIKVLEAMPNGYEYSSFYLKLCLMSLKEDGKLLFKGRIPYNAQLLSTITGHNIDIVKVALDTLQQLEMISLLDSGAMYINDIQLLIGTGSTEGERKKEYRKRIESEKKGLLPDVGQCPDICPPEIELELDLENREKEKEKEEPDTGFIPEEPKKKKPAIKSMEEIKYPSWLNVEAFEGFLQDRKDRKCPATRQAVVGLINRLEKCCDGRYDLQIPLIEKAICSAWKTFFPLKADEIQEPKEPDKHSEEYKIKYGGPPPEIIPGVIEKILAEAAERKARGEEI